MAILSIDTYLQSKISSILNSFLANPYIIREVILKEFDKKIVDSFINTFCKTDSSQGAEIPVLFTFPRSKVANTGAILVQFKGSEEPEEKDGAIGLLQGNTNASTGDYERETIEITVLSDEYGRDIAYFQLSNPISKYSDVRFSNMSLKPNDVKIDYKNNRVYIPYAYLHGNDEYTSTLSYDKRALDSNGEEVPESKEKLFGMTLEEVYTIDVISQNMDTIRCLSAIIKAILITMRTSQDEQVEYMLQSLTFHGMDLIEVVNNAKTSGAGEQLYYQRAEVGYTDTYSLPNDKGFDIDNLKLNED